jgi:hypothetical protein
VCMFMGYSVTLGRLERSDWLLFSFLFSSTGVWTQGLVFAKQAHYHSSHTSILFFVLVLFWIRTHVLVLRVASDCNTPYLGLQYSWDYGCVSTPLSCLWDEGLTKLFYWLPSNWNPLYLCF